MNRRGLFAGLAGVFAVPVAAICPKAQAKGTDIGKLVVTIEADTSSFEEELRRVAMLAHHSVQISDLHIAAVQ